MHPAQHTPTPTTRLRAPLQATHSKRVKLEGGENARENAAAAAGANGDEHTSRQPPASDFGAFHASLRRKSGPGGGSDGLGDAPAPALLSFADISSRGGGAACGAAPAARPTLLDSLKNIKGMKVGVIGSIQQRWLGS
jgi:hypothetical protein